MGYNTKPHLPSKYREIHVREQMAYHPTEAKIVRRVIRALKKAGTPVVAVWDAEEMSYATLERDLTELVFNLDEAWLMAEGCGWVRITLGNEWDAITDYTLDLESALAEVEAWIADNN